MFHRRQFGQFLRLWLWGLVLILLVNCGHQVSSNDPPTASLRPDSTPVISRAKNPAPEGLYAPVRGDIRLAVISDLNSQYGSTTYAPEVDKAIRLIPDWEPDLVLCGGDMIAGQKHSLSVAQIQAMWTAFDRHIAAPLRKAQIPFGFTIGNHDGSGAIANGKLTFAQERELAAAYWNAPEHDPGLTFVDRGQFPFYYSFLKDSVFYLVWDASTANISQEQRVWVEQALSSPSAQKAKLRLAIGHLPLYPIAVKRDNPGNYLADTEKLQKLLEKYRVHTYISGHHHAYYPGKRGQLELLHAGALGDSPRRLLGSNLQPIKTLTIVDIELSTSTTKYTTYDFKTMKVINHETLPTKIPTPQGTIWRRDFSPH